jgi:hypothetical protein
MELGFKIIIFSVETKISFDVKNIIEHDCTLELLK